jgi:hypothetical protein
VYRRGSAANKLDAPKGVRGRKQRQHTGPTDWLVAGSAP